MIIQIDQDIDARVWGVPFKGPSGTSYYVPEDKVAAVMSELNDTAVIYKIFPNSDIDSLINDIKTIDLSGPAPKKRKVKKVSRKRK